jgi:hypothetical protein
VTWTNAFDRGACTVQVGFNASNNIFSGVLAKGQTSGAFNGHAGSGEQLQAAVTSDGAVQLNWLSGSGPSLGYQVSVVPSYSIAGFPIRARGFDIPNGVSGPTGAEAWSSETGSLLVQLTGSHSTWVPDPADLTELGFQAYWTVYQGTAA